MLSESLTIVVYERDFWTAKKGVVRSRQVELALDVELIYTLGLGLCYSQRLEGSQDHKPHQRLIRIILRPACLSARLPPRSNRATGHSRPQHVVPP
jgi:hypothetical protein